MTPTELSRRKWRQAGYYVASAESIVRLPGGITRRNDLLGFVDLVAVPLTRMAPDGTTDDLSALVFIQTTSSSNLAARWKKILTEATGTGRYATPLRDLARSVILSGAQIVLEGWRKHPKTGRYECRERRMTLEALGSTPGGDG